MSGWHLFIRSVQAVIRAFPALLRATALWWVIFTALAVAASYALTGTLGSIATLRPDSEGEYPDLVATFAMVSLVINLISIGIVASLALPILVGRAPLGGWLPFPQTAAMVQMIWALVLTGLITVICAAVVSALSGFAAPLMSLGTGLVLLPILTALTFWFAWLMLLRLFARTLDMPVNPARRVGVLNLAFAASLFCATSIGLFLIGTLAVRSSLTEAIVGSAIGWGLLMLALAAMAVRLHADE